MPQVQFELQILAGAVLLGFFNLIWAAVSARRQQNLKWAAGPRDEPAPPLTGIAGRLDRAFANFKETFVFFAVLVIICYLGGRMGDLTKWGSIAYLAGRVIYLPVYAAGVPNLRTLVWAVSLVGIGMVGAAIVI